MRIAAVQLTPTTDPAENIAQLRARTAEAAAGGAEVVVFPEQTMVLLQSVTVEGLSDIAAAWWGPFYDATAELAREHSVVVVSAGFEPAGADARGTGLPLNTIVAIGPEGELARYRKLHLYEAFQASESEHTQAGSELPPVFTLGEGETSLTFGLANCYDVRFPELFRSLADRGVNAILLSAAWASGPGKEEHWDILTRARALENVSWFVACGTVGGGARGGATTGLSRVIDPLGVVLAALGPREPGIAFADIDAATVARARAQLPALANRRITLDYALG